jgi:hypothetical protein
MIDDNVILARVEDLLLTITRYGESWRAHVEEIDDPNSGLSDGTNYVSPDEAKVGAVTVARELFGTSIPEEELEWRGDLTG